MREPVVRALCWRLKEPIRTYERVCQVLVVILTACLALLAIMHIPGASPLVQQYSSALRDPLGARTAVLSSLVGFSSAIGICYRDASAVRKAIKEGISERRLLTKSFLLASSALLAFLALLALRPTPLAWRPDAPLLLNPLFLLPLSFSSAFLAIQAEIRWDRVVLLEVWPRKSSRWLSAKRFLIDALELQGVLASGMSIEKLAGELWSGRVDLGDG